MKKPATPILLSAAFIAAGCQTGQAPDHPVIPPASAQIWQLEQGQLSGKALNLAAAPEPITLVMQGDLLTGKSPVNHYNAPASIGGNTLRITGPIMTTRMASSAAAMHLESDYLQALQKAERYEKSGNRLTIQGEDIRLDYFLKP